MSILTKDLSDTTVGWWVFSLVLPVVMIVTGAVVIFNRGISLGWAEWHGARPMIDGVAFIALGSAIVGLPQISVARRRGLAPWNRVRVSLGLGIGGVCLVLGEFVAA